MKGKDSILLALSIVMLIACIGVGSATDFNGSTSSTADITPTYILINVGEDPTQSPFVFQGITYYRDRAITVDETTGQDTVVDTYRYNSSTTDPIKFGIASTESGSISSTLKIRLAQACSNATIAIRFFEDQSCTEQGAVTELIVLSTDDCTPITLDTNRDYYCKVTLTLNDSSITAVLSGTVSFSLVFMATASS